MHDPAQWAASKMSNPQTSRHPAYTTAYTPHLTRQVLQPMV